MEDRTDEVIEILSTSSEIPTNLLTGGYVNYQRIFSECKLLSWYSLNWVPATPSVPVVGMIMMAIEKSVYVSFSPRWSWMINILDPFNPRELNLLMWMLRHNISNVGCMIIRRFITSGYEGEILLKMCEDEVAAGNNRSIKYAVMAALFDELLHPSAEGDHIINTITPILVKCGEEIDWVLEMVHRATMISAHAVNGAMTIISFLILHVLSIADIITLFEIVLNDTWPKEVILFVAACLTDVLDEKTAVLTVPSSLHSLNDVYTAIAYYYPTVMRMIRSRRDILDEPLNGGLITCHHRMQSRGLRTIGDVLDRGKGVCVRNDGDVVIVCCDA